MRRFLRLPTLEGASSSAKVPFAGFCHRLPLARPDVGHILTLDVSPEARRGGIGKDAPGGSDRRAWCESGRKRKRSSRSTSRTRRDRVLREASGFAEAGRLADYYGEGRDAFEMVRRESAEGSNSQSRLLTPDP